ncbi:DUF3253 domain-containing protein [Marivita sp. GX14005]|nr:DUF3253 domain-containing protein [Marivita sp. GX14005]MCL3882073.1 DUF3253 domain-containing protein [Marivita sp. GX14005]
MRPSDSEIADVLMALARQRGPDKTFCPSEAARRLAEDWRALMPEVRRVARGLPLVATQKGAPVDAGRASGPIRLGLDEGRLSIDRKPRTR